MDVLKPRTLAVGAGSVLGLVCLAAEFGAIDAAQQTPSSPERTPQQVTATRRPVPDEVVLEGNVVVKRVPAKTGDICAVCNHPVGSDDPVFIVRGHRLPIHLLELDANPRVQLARLVAQLEPRGAFLGASESARALSRAWFLVGLYVLVGMVFAALAAHRALHAGHSPAGWFAAGLLLNVIGYLLLVSRGRRKVEAPAGVPPGLRKVSLTYAPQSCAACGAENHPSAQTCIGCGAALEPSVQSEVARAGLHSA